MVHRCKPVEIVGRCKSVLLGLFFTNHESLLTKHVIHLIADINERVIGLILQLVDPNDFNVIARYVEVKVKLNLIKKKFCRYDYSNLLIFIQEILSQHHNDESFSSTG